LLYRQDVRTLEVNWQNLRLLLNLVQWHLDYRVSIDYVQYLQTGFHPNASFTHRGKTW